MEYNANAKVDRALDWEDQIENESSFQLLAEGDYEFTVTQLSRERHPGSDKMPACPKAVLQIRAEGDQCGTTIRHQLFLHTKMEFRLSEFFVAIGQKKKGEPLHMDWSKVVGSSGICHVVVEKYTKDGQELESNKISKFYEPKDKNESKNFTPGRF